MTGDKRVSLRWVPLFAFLLAAAFGAYALKLRDDAWHAEQEDNLQHLAQIEAASVARVLERVLAAVNTLAVLVRHRGGSLDEFEVFARDILASAPGSARLQAAPDGVVARVHPAPGNEKVLGRDLGADPVLRRQARLAAETRQPILAGPHALPEGGQGMTGMRAVFLADGAGEERLWGLVSATIRMGDLLQRTDLPGIGREGYVYQLSQREPESGGQRVLAGVASLPAASASSEIDVPNGRWNLSLARSAEQGHAPLLWLDALVALAVAALLAWLVRGIVRQPQILQERVEAATAMRKALIDSIPDYIFMKDRDSVYLGCNKAYEARAGRREQEIVGRTDLDLYPAEEAQFYRAKDREMLAAGLPIRIEEEVRGEDGATRWFDTVKTPFFGPGGDVLGLVGICRDMTQRKLAERHFRLAETVFEAAAEGIVITGPDSRIIRVNPGFCRITGYPADEVVGQTPRLIASGRHDAAFYQRMWRELAERGRWEGEIWNRRKSGEVYPEFLSITAVRHGEGPVEHYVGVFSDITKRKSDEEFMRYQATHDPLTGLPNRTLFLDRLKRALAHGNRAGRTVALLFIDLDGFKEVNDALGHEAGDALLCKTAGLLTGCVREEDTVARIGGDEFTVMLAEVDGPHGAAAAAEKIRGVLAASLMTRGQEYRISASIGVALSARDGFEVDDLLRNADLAMYEAKHAGRNAVRFYSWTETA